MRPHLILTAFLVIGLSFGVLRGQTFSIIDPGFAMSKFPAAEWADIDQDGDLDVFCSGSNDTVAVAIFYRNDGGGSFAEIFTSVSGVYYAGCSFGDMNNDGLVDLALAGYEGSVNVSSIYRNDGGNSFADIGAGLTGLSDGGVAWVDYDNDGLLDLLLTGVNNTGGPQSVLYHNDGGESFSDASAGLTGLAYSDAAWADLDLDGDMDLVIAGENNSQLPQTLVYLNTNGTFSQMGAGLAGVKHASLNWGDYNNDSYPDLVIAGLDGSNTLVTAVYKNNGGTSFSAISGPFTGFAGGTAIWGDMDNDGNLDLVIAGAGSPDGYPPPPPSGTAIFELYINLGNDQFQQNIPGLEGPAMNAVALGDYDNDTDLDLFLAGAFDSPISAVGSQALIYRNETSATNNPPSAPAGLTYDASGSDLLLQWDASTDDKTPEGGLNYNLRLGTQQGNMDVMPAHADISSGFRQIVNIGNSGGNTSWEIKGLDYGTYYASVQAIDPSYAGSAFSDDLLISFAPTATFSLADTVCVLDQTTITYTGNASPSAIYNWDFDGAIVISGSGQGPYVVFWDTEGGKNVSLTVTQNGVTSDPEVNSILVKGPPGQPGDISGETDICQGTQSSNYTIEPIPFADDYEWELSPDDAGMLTSSGPIAVIDWDPGFLGTASITVRGVNECGNGPYADDLVISVNAVPGKAGKPEGPQTLCRNPGNTSYTSSGAEYATGYQWRIFPLEAGLILGNGLEAEVDWENGFTGTAGITVSGVNDCGQGETSDTLFVSIELPPVADAGEDQVIVYQSTTQLTGSASGGSGEYSYAWEPSELLVDPGLAQAQTIELLQSVQFTITVTDLVSGCLSSDQVVVTVTGGALNVDALANPGEICEGDSVQLLALTGGGSGTYTYSWTSYPEGFSANTSSPVDYPGQDIMYYVEVSDGSEQVSDSVSVMVGLLPSPAGVISGPEEVCAGDENILYAIDPVAGATQYIWTTDEGIFGSSDSTSILLSFSSNWTAAGGTLSVRPRNACGIGEASSTMILVSGVPEQPGMVSGEDTLCTTTDTITEYLLEIPVPGAIDYLWQLIPEEAGILAGDGLSAEMHWVQNWEGEAEIRLRAVNECGFSPWSESLLIQAYSCLGVDEHNGLAAFRVYPNPAVDILNISFSSPDDLPEEFIVRLSDLMGRVRLESMYHGKDARLRISLSDLPPGMYILSMHAPGQGAVSRKIVKKR